MALSTITDGHYTPGPGTRPTSPDPASPFGLPYPQGRVEECGERDGHPEVEEPIPEDRDRGLGPDPEHSEGGEHGSLEHADAAWCQWERTGRRSYAVGDEQLACAGRHPEREEHQYETRGVERPVAEGETAPSQYFERAAPGLLAQGPQLLAESISPPVHQFVGLPPPVPAAYDPGHSEDCIFHYFSPRAGFPVCDITGQGNRHHEHRGHHREGYLRLCQVAANEQVEQAPGEQDTECPVHDGRYRCHGQSDGRAVYPTSPKRPI